MREKIEALIEAYRQGIEEECTKDDWDMGWDMGVSALTNELQDILDGTDDYTSS